MRSPHRTLPALAVSGLLALGLSACSSTVSTSDLEAEVEKLATEQSIDVDSVDCPDALPAEVDATVPCTVIETNGDERAVDVTATAVDGDQVDFEVTEK